MAHINDLKGQYRILLVFAASDIDTDLLAFQREFEGETEAIRERDLRIFIVSEESGFAEWPENRPDTPKMDPTSMSARYDVADGDFSIVLIGKDGGEKHRASRAVEPEEIFQIIDAMPMRQNEQGPD